MDLDHILTVVLLFAGGAAIIGTIWGMFAGIRSANRRKREEKERRRKEYEEFR